MNLIKIFCCHLNKRLWYWIKQWEEDFYEIWVSTKYQFIKQQQLFQFYGWRMLHSRFGLHFSCFLSAWCFDVCEPLRNSWTLLPMSPSSHVTSCLHVRLTRLLLNSDSPRHTWLFLLLLTKPFDLSLTNSFSLHLLLSHYQFFINAQWQIYVNAATGRDPEMDGLIGVMVGWWAAWYRAGLPHTLVTYWQTAGGREWAWER